MKVKSKENSFNIVSILEELQYSIANHNNHKVLIDEGVDFFRVCRSEIYFNYNSIINTKSTNQVKELLFKWKSFSRRIRYIKNFVSRSKISNSEIIFFPNSITHLNQQIPLIRHLKNKQIKYAFASLSREVLGTLRDRGDSAIDLNLWIKSSNERSINYKSISSIFDNIKLENLDNLLSESVIQKCKNIVIEHHNYIYMYINLCSILYKEVNPKIIVLGNSFSTNGSTIAQYFKNKGVFVISIMHGNITTEINRFSIYDRYIVYGQQAKDTLIDYGKDARFIKPLGKPYLDDIPKRKLIICDALINELALVQNKKYILILLSGPGESVSLSHHLKIIHNLEILSQEFSDVQFVIKPHRKDNLEYYMRNKKSKLIIANKNQNLLPKTIFEWFHGCTAVITGASTAGNEAIFYNLPVVTIDLMKELEQIRFIREKVSFHVENYKNLKNVIKNIISNDSIIKKKLKDNKKYIDNVYYKADGNTSRRITDYISSFLD